MAQESKKDTPLKFLGSLIIIGAIGFMAWMWVTNYRTLTEAARVSDQVIEKQADNFRYYVNEYHVTKNELAVTTNKLVEVTHELEVTNTELSNTRDELAEIQQLNDQLKSNIKAMERYRDAALAKGEALEKMIAAFKQKNRELDKQLQSVRKELSLYQPEIDDLDQGKSKILRFKNHIKMVKTNMNGIKRKAFEVKVAAQKEHDRLETLYGNNGFLMKNGKDMSVRASSQKNIDVDVKFVD